MVYKHAVDAAFHIISQCGEDAAKRRGWRPCMEITLLIMELFIMEKSWNSVFWIFVGTLINALQRYAPVPWVGLWIVAFPRHTHLLFLFQKVYL